MKILHFTNSYYPAIGGIENVVENLCVELQKKGHQSDVLTLNKSQGGKFEQHATYKGSKIIRLPFLDLKYYKLSSAPFSLIKNYDLIHIHSLGFFSDLLLLTKPIHKKRIIVSTHGGFFHTQNIAGAKKFYFNTLERLLLKNADKIIADSKQDLAKFNEINKNIIRIDNGFSAPEPAGQKEKNTFLFVGRLSNNKGLENLINVFSKLKFEYKLWIIGKDFDNLRPALQKQIKTLGLEKKIDLLGPVKEKELYKYYSKAEYFVSASKYEGFGITAIEAMHFGCFCILNNIPTFKEFTSNKRGKIINYAKTEKASKEIEKIVRQGGKEKNATLKKAKEYSKKFLWKNKINEFLKVYGE